MAWRYDERDHTWRDDDPALFQEVNQELGYPLPSSPGGVFVAPVGTPAPPGGVPGPPWQPLEAYPEPLDHTLGYLAVPDLDASPGGDPVEQTLPFPAPADPAQAAVVPELDALHGDEPDDLFEPLEGHPEGLTVLRRMSDAVDEEGGIAMTAGEQDHSNPWTYAGDEADPPANPGAVA